MYMALLRLSVDMTITVPECARSKHVRGAGAEPGVTAGDPAAGKLPRGWQGDRTLANLSHWPDRKVDALQRALKGSPAQQGLGALVTRSLPHGHVAAVLGTARALGVEELIDPAPSRRRDLVTAMLVAQVIAPDSKLATARGLRTEPPPAPWGSCSVSAL